MIGQLVSALFGSEEQSPNARPPKLRLLPSLQETQRAPYRPGSKEHGDVLEVMERRAPQRTISVDRIALEANWVANAAFYGNKQHFSMLGNQIVEIPPDELEVRYLCNMILPYVLRQTQKVHAINGRFAVKPASGDTRDMEIARTSMNVWKHQRDVIDYETEKGLALLHAATCGTAFARSLFDPTSGDADRFYRTSVDDPTEISVHMMSDEDRRFRDRNMIFDDLPAGELDFEAVSAFQVFPDPASKRGIKHCRYITQRQWVPIQSVAEAFGVDEKDIKPQGQTSANLQYEQAIATMTPGFAWYGSNPQSKDFQEQTYLTQSWERPCREYPRGRYIAIAGELVLRDTWNPYCASRYRWVHLPWTKLDWHTMPGRFWGIGIVELLRSIQFRRNESRARMHEFEAVFGQPCTFMPEGGATSPNQMTTKPGSLVSYNPAVGTPTVGPKPELPSEVLMNAQTCDTEMARIASLSDVDTGRAPGQIRSAAGFEALFNDRDLALNHTMGNVLRWDRDNGRQHLAIAQLFYSAERVARSRGPGGSWAASQFTGADLNADVVMLGEPGEFESTASERSGLMQIIQAGGLNPQMNPQHAQVVVKALRYNSTEQLVEDILQHELRQEKELREITALALMGETGVYPIAPYEDDAAHMRVCERFFHTDEFERLPQVAKDAHAAHWQLHAAQAEQKQRVHLEMLALTQSTPGSKGVASQAKPG